LLKWQSSISIFNQVFFSSFLLCFLFIKFDRVSSQWAFLDLYIFFKCLNLWNIFYWWWWRTVIRRNRASWRVHWTCTGPLWGGWDEGKWMPFTLLMQPCKTLWDAGNWMWWCNLVNLIDTL
jgi:hypothetical protein